MVHSGMGLALPATGAEPSDGPSTPGGAPPVADQRLADGDALDLVVR